jgi:uncharacterized repeat protein (TIGR04052 family)
MQRNELNEFHREEGHRMKTKIIAWALASAMGMASAAQALSAVDVNGMCIGDANMDGQVSIDELIAAVNNALNSCPKQNVTIQFRGAVNGQPFACGQTYEGVGTSSSQFVPADFRFFVSNFRLVTPDGTEVPVQLDQDGAWQVQNLALIDFEDATPPCGGEGTPQTNDKVTGTVLAGTYTGVRFQVGVPFDLNHGDAGTAPDPLSLTSMFWNWRGGHKFVRVDTALDQYRFHLGSTGCVGTPPVEPVTTCSRLNMAEIDLTNFDPASNVIVADLGALFSDSDLNANQPDTPPGCMADPDDMDCAPIMRNLGIDFATGSATPGTQKFFHVE